MSKRTKFLLGIGVIAALVIGFQVAAYAVHDEVFQLEGNAVDDTTATEPDDWENVLDDPDLLPDGADETSFVAEPNPATTFFTGGGSKDPQDIPNWLWKNDTGGLPDKANIRDSYAASYTVGTPERELLYFGADRFDASGDAAIAFWFLQDEVSLDPPPPPSGTATGDFIGQHQEGDVLVISNFSNGGTVSTITVYSWDPSCTKATNNNPQTDDCGAANLRVETTSTDANCDSPNPDSACAIVNSETEEAPWDFLDKDGNTDFQKGEFFEGGIDLTALDLDDQCFATALAETRTSTSPTSVLKDFTIGPFGACGSSVVTTPEDGNGVPIPINQQTGKREISIGTGSVQVKDSAAVTVDGTTTWAGSVKFFLCKIETQGQQTCASGGAEIAPAQAVSNTTSTVESAAATVTAAGNYCWRAEFTSTTPGVPPSSDSTAGECFTVTPVTPTLTTNASGNVNLGNPITDTATLTGTANKPGTGGTPTPSINPTTPGAAAGGTITFRLYGPDDATCSNAPVFTSSAVPVTGDGTYGPVSFTPTAAGTYRWVATYSGDLPNTNAKAGACNDANENVTVTSVKSSMTSTQSFIPNDSATVSAPAGGNLAGTVKFELFENATCSGTPIYTTNPEVPVSGTSPQTVSTNNTTVSTTSANVSWRLTYDSTNPAQQDIPATCLEKTALTIDNGGTATSP